MDLTKVFDILKVEALDESAKAEVEKFVTDLIDIKAKDKALEISEAVLAEAKEELTEEFEQKFEDYKEEILGKWSDFVDGVLSEELVIPDQIKEYAKYGEQFKPILDTIRTQLGINEGSLDETAKDLLGEAKEEIVKLRDEYNSLMSEAVELREDAKHMAAHIYLRKKCDGLTEAQKTKVMNLIGDLTDAKQINEKFDLVLEHVLDEKKKHKEPDGDECDDDEEKDDEKKSKKKKKKDDGAGVMESHDIKGSPFDKLVNEYAQIAKDGKW